MKTPHDPRHKNRKKIVKKLYEFSFGSLKPIPKQIQPICDNLDKIDKTITKCAPEWPLEKLNKLDLAILRLALFELLIDKKNPVKVVIDEAIELGKEYGSD
ncbi:transcription antitermination protein NusB, partial [Patescibacteria group bacterium]